MPKQRPVTSYVLICERVLSESNGILSAIRIADYFTTDAPAEVPGEQVYFHFQLVGSAKFALDDDEPHTAQLQIIRPDGSARPVGAPSEVPATSRVGGTHKGFNLVLDLRINLKQPGLHFAALLIDGEESCRSPFRLERQATEGRGVPAEAD